MAVEPDLGYGLLYEIYYSGVYTAVEGADEVQPGEETADRVDTTHYQSPNRRRQHIAGLIDVGTGTVRWLFDPNNATHQMLRALKTAGTTVNHRITYPDGQTVVYPAIVTAISQALPIDDAMRATFSFEVNGDETWTG